VGRKYSDGTNWWVKNRVPSLKESDLAELEKAGGVISPDWLEGPWGERLAAAHALQPSYEPPDYIGTETQLSATMDDLGQAKYVVISQKQYKGFQKLLETARKNDWDVFHQSKTPVGGTVGLPSFFPLSVRPAHPVLDPNLAYALALERGWTVDRTSGGYLILVPKE